MYTGIGRLCSNHFWFLVETAVYFYTICRSVFLHNMQKYEFLLVALLLVYVVFVGNVIVDCHL